MSTILICCLIGYLIGCLSPAWAIGKIKQVNIRNLGSGNLGGTNVLLTVGKSFGIFVIVFDIFKTVLAIHIARMLFSDVAYAPVLTGVSTIIGHIHPFYLKFHGGKGSACLVGSILGITPKYFIPIVVTCIAIGVVVNYLCISPILASISFTIVYTVTTHNYIGTGILLIGTFFIIIHHIENLKRVINHTEPKVRDYIKKK